MRITCSTGLRRGRRDGVGTAQVERGQPLAGAPARRPGRRQRDRARPRRRVDAGSVVDRQAEASRAYLQGALADRDRSPRPARPSAGCGDRPGRRRRTPSSVGRPVDLAATGVGGDQHAARPGGAAEGVQRADPVRRDAQRLPHAAAVTRPTRSPVNGPGPEPGDDRAEVAPAGRRPRRAPPRSAGASSSPCARASTVRRSARPSHAGVGDLDRDRRRGVRASTVIQTPSTSTFRP